MINVGLIHALSALGRQPFLRYDPALRKVSCTS
jgi:hypothetical protein